MTPILDLRGGDPRAMSDAAQASTRPPTASETDGKSESPATEATAFSSCPRCNKPQAIRTSTVGFWETRILSFVRIRPYQCGSCGCRFHRFNIRYPPTTAQSGLTGLSTFVLSSEHRDFDDLI